MTPPSTLLALGRNALAAGLLAALGLLALRHGQVCGLSAAIWPAAGLAFAFTHVWGSRVVPGIALGSLAVTAISLWEVGEPSAVIWKTAVTIALGAALQACVASALVRGLVGFRLRLDEPGTIILTLLLAGPVACLVNPTVGVAAQVANAIISDDQAAIGWVIGWAGNTLGVIVFGPLTLMFLPGQQEAWTGRRLKVILPSLIVLAGLWGAFFNTSAVEREHTEQEVQRLVLDAKADLVSALDLHEQVLVSVADLQSVWCITAEEFETFTAGPLERFPNLHALSWNPIIARDDLAAFEASQRALPGREGFTVTERGEAGALEPVSPRPDHVVVQFIEPLEFNRPALGFDIQSNPVRAAAIHAARDTGLTTATAVIDLVQESGTQKGMLALRPVYAEGVEPGDVASRRAALRGFAVGVYLLGDLLEETYATFPWDRTDLRLVDVTAGEPKEIAAFPAREAATIDVVSGPPQGATARLDVYGRTWEILVTPTSGPLAKVNPTLTTGFLVIVVLAVFLLQVSVLLITGLEQSARREATDSSYEASHDVLTGLLNRRAFMRHLQGVLGRKREASSTDVLLFCDLDGFKPVNDRAGHEAGDRMLVTVAAALRQAANGSDIVARLGGDEFAVVLVNCPPARGRALAETIHDRVRRCVVRYGDLDLSVGISIGGTVIRAGATEVDELLRRADAACYAAKRGESGPVRMFEEMPAGGTGA